MFGTGTDAPVPVVTLFLLCLLSEAFAGCGAWHPLTPSWVPWSVWTRRTALILRSLSIPAVAYAGVVLLGFPCAVLLYIVVRPQMLRIKAGMNPKDSDAGLFCW